MLSYRHAFHAGNHADVLKHFILSLVLDYFNQKDKPYWMIDTHAGAGMYELGSTYAQKNTEFETGIARLFTNSTAEFARYIQCIQSFNLDNQLRFYPGSPKISSYFLRDQDKLRLFELHPNDYKILSQNFESNTRQTKVELQSGFEGIKACLPPPTKRAVILIDPPYEVKDDYQHVINCIKDSLKRFATGTYLIWYPLLQRPEPESMLDQLKSISHMDFINATLSVQAPSAEGFGMHGSGMFIINPPWKLPEQLRSSLPALVELLALDANASFSLDYRIQ